MTFFLIVINIYLLFLLFKICPINYRFQYYDIATMKESWATETVLQEASLGTDLPASPASQCSQSTAELPELTGKSIVEQEDNILIIDERQVMDSDMMKDQQREVRESLNCETGEIQEEKDEKKKWCSRRIPVLMDPSSDVSQSVPLPSRGLDGNQPMEPYNMSCTDDEEQIVPQSDANCVISQGAGSDRQMPSVNSRIMKMGLKDVMDEADRHQDSGINSLPLLSTSTLSSSSTVLPTMSLSAPSSQNHSILSNKTLINPLWYRQSQHNHKIFGPLARPSPTAVPDAAKHSLSSPPISRSKVRERTGSPVITHKKFDYQMKLTLQNTDAPLDLCKRSPPCPSTRSRCSPEKEESTSKPTSSIPMDLTTKIPSKEKPQKVQFSRPVNNSKIETLTKHKQPQFIFGAKPELDRFSSASACSRMSHFFSPRPSSCSPSSSDHSSSSGLSMVDQRSDPDSVDIPDVKPPLELLPRLPGSNIGMFRFPDATNLPMSPFINPTNVYPQQFITPKTEGGVYRTPCGYTTAVCAEPTSSSSSPSSGPSKPDKLFICQECHAVFKHRHHVVRHMRAHSGERPFRCDECGATFARKCILTNHRRIHSGEKPYICTECGDTFSRKHHLVIHRRTHTGEKPYRCLECGAAFARSHHLNRHRKTHGGAKTDPPTATTGRMFFANGLSAGTGLFHPHGFMLPQLSPRMMAPRSPLPVGNTHTDTLSPRSPNLNPYPVGTPPDTRLTVALSPKIPHPSSSYPVVTTTYESIDQKHAPLRPLEKPQPSPLSFDPTHVHGYTNNKHLSPKSPRLGIMHRYADQMNQNLSPKSPLPSPHLNVKKQTNEHMDRSTDPRDPVNIQHKAHNEHPEQMEAPSPPKSPN